ncbi:major pollen allergen Lol p 11-like [Phoenix dactylifera]|uniref:Major pollen allergen Lol p 11-like n=1 Tax=Phoenix dactylifera TaxID=42345 RepID=A0A8B7CDU2_PHODC|nr:major pollen allergen Lol p 11-like [Phoenix dactylifera]XP_008797142.2 major pollen allergen Lol p 11-like [Phoenix dactylifera]
MAKLQLLPVLVALVLALAGVSLAHDPVTKTVGDALNPDGLVLEGRVYCDTCRAGFETDLTAYIPGAKVRLECTRYGTDEVTYAAEATTDLLGIYQIVVPGDHSEDQCSVVLMKSAVDNCTEIKPGRDRARVVLAQDGGLLSNVRRANALGFLIAEPLAECGKLLQKYGFANDDD